MIEIKIEGTKDLYITSDAHNFILSKRIGIDDKTGNPKYRGLSYHKSIDHVLEGYLSTSLKQSNAKSVEELLDIQYELLQNIKKTFEACELVKNVKLEYEKGI